MQRHAIFGCGVGDVVCSAFAYRLLKASFFFVVAVYPKASPNHNPTLTLGVQALELLVVLRRRVHLDLECVNLQQLGALLGLRGECKS